MQITQLVEKFEKQDFKGGDFFHLEHLKIAWHYICHEPFVLAKQKFHGNVQALVKKLGAEDKYHRTLTDFFLDYLLQLRWYLGSNDWTMVEKHCPMIIEDAKKIVGFYYSEAVICSEEARLGFVEPDIMALDRASLKLGENDPAVFELEEFESPLIVSIPHNGQFIPHSVLQTMLPSALDSADTDWYLSRLYHFLDELKITRISANYSRYLIDLNRNSSGEELYKNANNTELCPTSTFDLEPLYPDGAQPDQAEIKRRIEAYWQPYHQQLKQLISKAKAKFGYALVFEAHSIASRVPRFFEGQLPDFNFGTNDGATVNAPLVELLETFATGEYSKVLNGRFKGGFITRHYAKPQDSVYTIQLELSQATYMDEQRNLFEPKLAAQVQPKLKQLIGQLSAC